MTPQADYTIRQAAYDLRKLRGKGLAVKPGRTRRYHIDPQSLALGIEAKAVTWTMLGFVWQLGPSRRTTASQW
jgi:hypothetical protein